MDRTDSTPPEKHAESPAEKPKHDPYAALRVPAFRQYTIGNFLSIMGLQMQSAAVGYEVYHRTHEAISLAYVGISQVLPVVTLAIFAGHIADRFDRRRIVMTAVTAISLGSTGLAIISLRQAPVGYMYLCLFLAGIARAFQQPAKSSLLPHLVRRRDFPNAITWNMAAFQLASVLGPAAFSLGMKVFNAPAALYFCDAAFAMCFFGVLSQIRYRRRAIEPQPFTLQTLAAGGKFVWQNKIILAATSLDMFGVLFGAAVALLPVYAEDILHAGPAKLGIMYSAPAVGAVVMSFVISHQPPMKHAGRSLLWAVTGFGVATIVFGFSRWFPLSVLALLMTGAMDNVSVIIRHSLIQLLTPDEMRGRVSAVNGMFISISNEVGDIESGGVAQAFGPKSLGYSIPAAATISVVSGGMGTLAVVAVIWWLFPELRRFGRLDSARPEKPPMTPAEAVGEEIAVSENPRTAG
jgi:MFS family permease